MNFYYSFTLIMKAMRCCNCGKLLATVKIKDGIVAVKCKCGTMNSIEVKPDGQSYEDRLKLVKK